MILFDNYSLTVLVTLIYCIMTYLCGFFKIFQFSEKKRTASAALLLGGTYLNVEHFVYWGRWDIDHFGHEQLGMVMIGLFAVIRIIEVINNGKMRYVWPFYSNRILAKHYYPEETLITKELDELKHNLEKRISRQKVEKIIQELNSIFKDQ